jgi:ribosomal protein L32
MIIIDDNNTCSKCGAYYQSNNYCTNGHMEEE